MLIHSLLVAHVAVLGYWLGAELVINSTFRHVALAATMPFPERDRLLDHVMDVDQHVRYALILQAGIGFALTALLAYLPGGPGVALAAALGAGAWLVLVELTHRRRKTGAGAALALADHALRHLLMVTLLLVGALALAGPLSLPAWLAWKLILFAAVIACGVGIRLQLIRFFALWRELPRDGTDAVLESEVRRNYRRATAILILLWLCIAGVVVLSVLKPV